MSIGKRQVFSMMERVYSKVQYLERKREFKECKRSNQRIREGISVKYVVTNFIQLYLHQFFDDSHGLNSYEKPLKRPFN